MRTMLCLLLLASPCALAQLPSDTLGVTGILMDSVGAPATGPVTLAFRLYDVATGGAPLWVETHAGVPLSAEGRYAVQLGTITPLSPAFFVTDDRWLGVEANADGEMIPRLALGTVPYSHNSNLLEGQPSFTFAPRAELDDGTELTTPVGWFDLSGVPAGFADGVDDVADADSDPTNELQSWGTLPGIPAGFADGIDDVVDADADPANERNTSLALVGTDLQLTDAGGTLVAALGSLVDDADADAANELNTSLALNGTNLELTDAGGTLTVDLGTLGGGAGGGGGGGGRSLAYPDPIRAVAPVTLSSLGTTPYMVPAGKTLYVTNVYSSSSSNLLLAGGVNAVRGYTNQGESSGNQTLGLPLLLGAGEVLSANSDGMVANGFLVDATVTPFHLISLGTTPYVVPAGQVLVVLHVCSFSSSNVLTINGSTVVRGYTNQGESSGSQVIDQPVLAAAGDAVGANSDSVGVHGYLFGGTLAGSGAAVPGDFSFPDGQSGISAFTQGDLFTTPYSPPAGKNLYITSYRCSSNGAALTINGLSVFDGNSNYGAATSWDLHLDEPILVGAADVLATTNNNPVVNGFLVDATVTPLTLGSLSSTPYIVPAGQLLVILAYRCSSNGASLQIDGRSVFDGNSNYGGATSWSQRLGRPILVGAGQTLSTSNNNPCVNGYLRAP